MNHPVYGLKRTETYSYHKTTDVDLFIRHKDIFRSCEEQAVTSEQLVDLLEEFRHHFGPENVRFEKSHTYFGGEIARRKGDIITVTKKGIERYFRHLRDTCKELMDETTFLPVFQFIESPALKTSYRDLKDILSPVDGTMYYYNGILFNTVDFARECWMLMNNTCKQELSFTLEQVFHYS